VTSIDERLQSVSDWGTFRRTAHQK